MVHRAVVRRWQQRGVGVSSSCDVVIMRGHAENPTAESDREQEALSSGR